MSMPESHEGTIEGCIELCQTLIDNTEELADELDMLRAIAKTAETISGLLVIESDPFSKRVGFGKGTIQEHEQAVRALFDATADYANARSGFR